MKYIKQFCIILLFSFIGEVLNHLIPLPVPASIYGMLLLFLALLTGIVKLGQVEGTAQFLIEIMPVMFIPAAVGLLESWGIVRESIVEFVAVMAVSTVVVMAAAGLVTQLVIRRGGKDKKGETK
ncbi:MAG: CidA/LrgA family protein [Ruminococcus sp.]|nr:CidA/LrgA family protein [Ruminococcus sp.]